MKQITLDHLKQHQACNEQVRLFAATFGASASLTLKNLNKAIKAGLQINWLTNLLTPENWAEYKRVRAPAWAEYERVRDTAWAEYKRVRAPAWAEYERVRAPAWAEYQRATAPAWAEYERVAAPAWAEYQRVTARTLLKLLKDQKTT
jgi:uncharacterized membrane protein YqiK